MIALLSVDIGIIGTILYIIIIIIIRNVLPEYLFIDIFFKIFINNYKELKFKYYLLKLSWTNTGGPEDISETSKTSKYFFKVFL